MSGELQVIKGTPDPEDASNGAAPLDLAAADGEEVVTPLGALLVERGDLSGQQLRDALGAQTSGGKRLGEILVELGVISERILSSALAEQSGLEAVDISRARPTSPSSGCSPRNRHAHSACCRCGRSANASRSSSPTRSITNCRRS